MKQLETLISEFGLTKYEISRLIGVAPSMITMMVQCNRSLGAGKAMQCIGLASALATGMKKRCTCHPFPVQVMHEMIATEQQRIPLLENRHKRLLNKLENLQKQIGIWETLCTCSMELCCSMDWIRRRSEQKKYMLEKLWEKKYLPLLLKLRQSETRLHILQQCIDTQ